MAASDTRTGRRLVIAAVLLGALTAPTVFLLIRGVPEDPARAEPPRPPEPAPPTALGPKEAPRRLTALTVVTRYEGMSPEEVEALVTNRVERWVGQQPGVASTESRSTTGVSVVRLTLQPDADPAVALGGVNSLVLGVLPHLPAGCEPPLVLTADPGAAVGLVVVQSSAVDESQLADIARNAVRPALARLAGVVAPVVLGGKERRLAIVLDPRKMEARNLTAADVLRALDAARFDAARPGEPGLVVVPGAALTSPADFNDLPIRTEAGRAIYLRDVAHITDAATRSSFVRIDGKRAACVPVFPFGAAPAVGDVRKAVGRVESGLPEGTKVTFLPCGGPDDPAELTVHLRAPADSTLDATEKRVAAVERFLADTIPAAEREWIVSEAGVGADAAPYTRHVGPSDATIRVRLSGRRAASAAEYALKLREAFGREKSFADLTARFRAGPLGFAALGNEADLALRIRGGSAGERREAAERLHRRVAALAGVAGAEIGQRWDSSCLRVELDREKLAVLGLSAADVSRQIAAVRTSGASGWWLEPRSGGSYRVTVGPPDAPGGTLEQLLDLPLETNGKRPVPLRAVARIEKESVPVEITHVNGRPVLDVWIDVAGKNAEAVAAEVERALREEKVPAGISVELRRLSPDANR